MKRHIIIAGITIGILAAANSLKAQEKVIEKSFDGIDELSVNLGSGDATFKKGSSPTVRVLVKYKYDEDEFTAKFEQKGSKLVVKEKFERGHSSGYSKWTFTIPDGLDVEVNTGSGDLLANDLGVHLNVNSGSGDIELANLSGSASVNTGSGDVGVDTHNGKFSINSGSGDVDVSSASGKISVNTGSGDINLRKVEGEFSINTGSGDIGADGIALADLAAKSSFNAGSGDVRIGLSNSLDHDISINSGSGVASLDFNGVKMEGELIMKAAKNRGEIIAPFDFDEIEEETEGRQTIVKKTKKFSSKDITIRIATGSGKAIVKE